MSDPFCIVKLPATVAKDFRIVIYNEIEGVPTIECAQAAPEYVEGMWVTKMYLRRPEHQLKKHEPDRAG